MKLLQPEGAPFKLVCEKELVVFENQYVRCAHSPAAAGGLCEAVIKNGSGKNMFAAPQKFIIGITENGLYHLYTATEGDCRISEHEGNPVFESRSIFKDANGTILEGIALDLKVEYTPWGEALFRVEFDAQRKITDLGMVQVGTLYASKEMNCLALQECLEESVSPYMGNAVKRWIDVKPSPHPTFQSR